MSTFYEIHLITVQTVCQDFQRTALLFPNKSLLPAESFQVFLYVSSGIHNPMQEFLSCVYFGPVGHVFH
jgi:hypothetical protein